MGPNTKDLVVPIVCTCNVPSLVHARTSCYLRRASGESRPRRGRAMAWQVFLALAGHVNRRCLHTQHCSRSHALHFSQSVVWWSQEGMLEKTLRNTQGGLCFPIVGSRYSCSRTTTSHVNASCAGRSHSCRRACWLGRRRSERRATNHAHSNINKRTHSTYRNR